MPTAISGSIASANVYSGVYDPSQSKPTSNELEVKETFQDFVAGTFFKQMLKAMRKTHDKAAYFHGGQAEDIFQGQMDQQIAESLAKDHGKTFSDPLFRSFQINLHNKRTAKTSSQTVSVSGRSEITSAGSIK